MNFCCEELKDEVLSSGTLQFKFSDGGGLYIRHACSERDPPFAIPFKHCPFCGKETGQIE